MTTEQERLAVLEVRLTALDEDVKEVRAEIRDIKRTLEQSHAGLSRPERIALLASGSAVVGAIIGVIALLTGGHPS